MRNFAEKQRRMVKISNNPFSATKVPLYNFPREGDI